MRRLLFALPVLAGLLMFGIGTSAQASAQSDNPGDVAAGKVLYEMGCNACHADDGTGVAGRGRPLIGIASQGDRATHIASITDGKGGMPGFGDRFSAEEIEQVTSYVRLTFVEQAADADTELAVTGFGSTELAFVGFGLLGAGVGLVTYSRRQRAA